MLFIQTLTYLLIKWVLSFKSVILTSVFKVNCQSALTRKLHRRATDEQTIYFIHQPEDYKHIKVIEIQDIRQPVTAVKFQRRIWFQSLDRCTSPPPNVPEIMSSSLFTPSSSCVIGRSACDIWRVRPRTWRLHLYPRTADHRARPRPEPHRPGGDDAHRESQGVRYGNGAQHPL